MEPVGNYRPATLLLIKARAWHHPRILQLSIHITAADHFSLRPHNSHTSFNQWIKMDTIIQHFIVFGLVHVIQQKYIKEDTKDGGMQTHF